MRTSIQIPEQIETIPLQLMKPGQAGVIVGGTYDGNKVMRTFSEIFNLDNPSITWDAKCFIANIALFPTGTTITITL